MPNMDFESAEEEAKWMAGARERMLDKIEQEEEASKGVRPQWVIQCWRCKDTVATLRGSIDKVSADLLVYCQECYDWALEFPTRR